LQGYSRSESRVEAGHGSVCLTDRQTAFPYGIGPSWPIHGRSVRRGIDATRGTQWWELRGKGKTDCGPCSRSPAVDDPERARGNFGPPSDAVALVPTRSARSLVSVHSKHERRPLSLNCALNIRFLLRPASNFSIGFQPTPCSILKASRLHCCSRSPGCSSSDPCPFRSFLFDSKGISTEEVRCLYCSRRGQNGATHWYD
jgi:hypothetical protein